MSVKQETARSGTSRGDSFGECHRRKRWNRIESSSSDDEVIESSQDSPLVSGIARKILLSYNSRRFGTQAVGQKKTPSEDAHSDLDDVPEDPIELQPREFGSCPRGSKRMPPLACIVQTAGSGKKQSVTKRRLEMGSRERQSSSQGSNSKRKKVESDSEEQRNLVALIDNDSSDSAQDTTAKESHPVASASKKFVKTPSTTIDWDESPVDSAEDLTIDSVPEVEDPRTPVVFTRIVVDEVSVHFGLCFIYCTINEESSILLIRHQKGVTIKKDQILEVDLPENSYRIDNDTIYVVDKHRIVNQL